MGRNTRNARTTRENKTHESLKVKNPVRLTYKEKCRVRYQRRQKYAQVPNSNSD